MHYKSFLSSMLLLLTTSAMAQLNLQIQPSRTTGIAPLYVFFDATTTTGLTGETDLINADFSWDFDQTNVDPNGNWERTKGMVAGHVFELPGTYTVQCVVTASNGTRDTATYSLTVQAFTGITYYVSTLGDDSNDGLSEMSPWRTANFAFDQLSANERILFHRGETFANVSYNFRNLSGGKMIIGAYGTGSKPILQGAVGEDRMLELDFIDDLVFQDIHTFVNAPNVVSSNFHIERSANVLLLDVEMENAAAFAVYNGHCNAIGVFDSYMHHFGVLATYAGDGTRLSWVGNQIDSLIGTPQPEHGMRIQGGEKQFIAHNTLTNLINTKTAITIRGDGQQHVMLYRNKMDRLLGVNPQNAQTVAAISQITIEGNYVGQNTDYTGTSWENAFNGISIEATRVAIRNNVIDGYHNAINVSHDYNGVVSSTVEVYHNTVNWRPVSPISFNNGRIVRVRDVSNVNIFNNLMTVPTNITQGTVVAQNGTNTNINTGHNAVRTTAAYATNPLPNSEADANDITNYQLLPTSIAIDSGATNIPVFYDALHQPRMMPDLGAFEWTTCKSEDLVLSGTVTTPKNYATNGTITSTEVINANIAVIYNAAQFIDLRPGFLAMGGASFLGEITDCSVSLAPIVTPSKIKSTLEIAKIEENIQLVIAPNPVQNVAHVNYYLPKPSEVTWQIFNTNGQIMTTQLTHQQSGWHQTNISTEQLPTGIYYLNLRTDNKQLTRKIVLSN